MTFAAAFQARRAGGRSAGVLATLALHLLLAAFFMLRQPARAPQAPATWIEMVRVAPPARPVAPLPQAPRTRPAARPPVQARAVPGIPAPSLPPAASPAEPAPPFPEHAPVMPGLFELARSAAGAADRDLRKAFPERKLIRARLRTEREKLADGIGAAVAPPKIWEAPRITSVTDQGTGWGRRIDKVVTGMGTYCLTYEGNHGGDGRDVFKDALQVKKRTCPREE